MHQFSGQRRQAIVMAIGPTVLNREVLVVDQTRFTQALPKRCDTVGVGLRRAGTEEADHRHTRLLRARRQRPRRRAAEQRYEIAAFHSITSSASATTVGGSSSPIDLAVFKLITNR